MKRIDITEVDKTTPSGAGAEPTDIVYVPGLSTIAAKGTVIAVNNDEDFVEKLGSTPVSFANNAGVFDDAGINYSVDLSYIYARNLVNQGLTVVYDVVENNSASVQDIYNAMYNVSGTEVYSCFDKLKEPGQYNVKYITSGAYPSLYNPDVDNHSSSSYKKDISERMILVASTRGDAGAVIDHASNIGENVYKDLIEDANFSNGEYATIMTPGGDNKTELSGVVNLPASYAYLSALAKSIKTNANYLAIAGVTRGVLPNVKKLDFDISNAKADSYQRDEASKTSINAITNINPYGLAIWGNRTLLRNSPEGGLTSGSYLNLRSLIYDIKKYLRSIALSLLFEQNSDVLWLKFKSRISPILDKMIAGNGILDYELIKNKVKDKSQLSIDVVITPVYDVESVKINVIVKDDDVTVA